MYSRKYPESSINLIKKNIRIVFYFEKIWITRKIPDIFLYYFYHFEKQFFRKILGWQTILTF